MSDLKNKNEYLLAKHEAAQLKLLKMSDLKKEKEAKRLADEEQISDLKKKIEYL